MKYRDEHHHFMPYLSEKGRRMSDYLKNLADDNGYKKLSYEESSYHRNFYMEELDDFWKTGEFKNYELNLTTHDGTVLARGVSSRGYVCGDYGVFLEIEDDQMDKSALRIQPGEEYRIDNPHYSDKVKYHWYTDKENNGIKIYHQQKEVTYADYKKGKWYISPYEIRVVKVREKTNAVADLSPDYNTVQMELFR